MPAKVKPLTPAMKKMVIAMKNGGDLCLFTLPNIWFFNGYRISPGTPRSLINRKIIIESESLSSLQAKTFRLSDNANTLTNI